MNKSQLVDGYKVLLENGWELFVCEEHLLSENHVIGLNEYHEDLTHIHSTKPYMIVAVYNHSGEKIYTCNQKQICVAVNTDIDAHTHLVPDETEKEFINRVEGIYIHTRDGDKISLGKDYLIQVISDN